MTMSKKEQTARLEPRLRFPEFRHTGQREPRVLGELIEVASGQVDPTEPPFCDMPHVSGEHIMSNGGGLTELPTAKELGQTSGKYVFGPKDILYSKIRPALNKVAAPAVEGTCSADIYPIRPATDDLNRMYLFYLLHSDAFLHYAIEHSARSKIPKLNRAALQSFSTPLPAPAEQQRIADCLGSLDDRIAAETEALAALHRHKSGLIQQLFPRLGETRPRLRFPEFGGKSEWRQRRIGEILVKKAVAVTLDRDTLYREIGVRSHGKGLFHKEAVPGSSLGAKRVFRVVPDALVFNIVFAWERAVTVTTEAERGFVASHRFPMFLPRSNRCDVRFMQRLFLTPIGKEILHIASPGGAGRNRTLSQSDLSNLHAVVPDVNEQNRIADCFASLDTLLTTQTEKLAALRVHKRGLMQQLFPPSDAVEGGG